MRALGFPRTGPLVLLVGQSLLPAGCFAAGGGGKLFDDDAAADVAPDAAPEVAADVAVDVAPDATPDIAAPDAAADAAPDVVCRTRCSGFCVDTMTDLNNCGGCGNDCVLRPGVDPARVRCEEGACGFAGACLPGRAHCSAEPDDACEAVVSTAARCGGCATACPTSAPNCGRMAGAPNGYACTSECVDPTPVRCGALCVDPPADPRHCGACGTVCPTTAGGAPMCVAGVCRVVCATGFADCDRSPTNGCEVAVGADARNCGSCGSACPSATPFCLAGVCALTRPTRYTRAAVGPPIGDFVTACGMPGAVTALAGTDDSSTRVALAFPFRFWATDLSAGASVNVSSDGFLNLDGVSAANLSGAVPSASTPNGTVAAYWGDNMNRTPGQCFVTVGAAPTRRQVFMWSDAHHCCTNDPSVHHSYEIALHEAGPIDVLYQRMEGVRAQTVGLENTTGTAGVSGCADGTSYTCAPATGFTVRYTPVP